MNSKYTVLIVDDDGVFLDMAEEALREDFSVSTALSGYEALKLIAEGFVPDIILIDIDMPGLNGFETLTKLRANQPTAAIPVLFLTGLDPWENEARGFALGAQDYISKPFVQSALPLRVKNHIETARRLREKNTLDEEKLQRLTEPLTETEMKVVRLLAKGYANEEIAQELHYSLVYVKKLVMRVFAKLNIEHRGKIFNYLK
ncbi:MAG TPA: response regulator transcription factor [Desulfitobacterium dehalogenans]|uniref:Stage 0 sporulation protein A homolog n=1 Tax=Desulfitobacterium dehalogenans TaxID=36854 RepID=A0A7C6Z7P5_9FIRM|nr:response regulator transcription factor [Desulfitobacterium dehalogenans]